MAENKHNIIIVGSTGAGISAQMQSAMMRDDINIITVEEAELQGLNIHELARPEPMKFEAIPRDYIRNEFSGDGKSSRRNNRKNKPKKKRWK